MSVQGSSPYRADREGPSIAADVYSLGVVLLQLLTDRAPQGLAGFARSSVSRANAADLLLATSIVEWPAQQALAVARLAVRSGPSVPSQHFLLYRACLPSNS